jgi:predicted GNAT superfamily acetyltransferase
VDQPASAERLLRPLESAADYAACVALQEATWGRGFADRVPPSLLMIAPKVGGIAAGAFEAAGALVGLVLGFTGLRHGEPAHWSHMLAVRADRRDQGIGRALKQFQRDRLLASGVRVMYWTFDPLVARNAHLNLTRLGVTVDEYVPDFYGPGEDSPLDRGIGTDRLVVRWNLPGTGGDEGQPRSATAGKAVPVRVVVPDDIHRVKARSVRDALAWREKTRRAFLDLLGRGYRVVGFERAMSGRGGCYVLSPPESTDRRP